MEKLRRIVFINLKGSIIAAVHAEEQRKFNTAYIEYSPEVGQLVKSVSGG